MGWERNVIYQRCRRFVVSGGTCYDTGEKEQNYIINSARNGVNQISMDQIYFSVALIPSYSDHKLNVSTGCAKVVGTYGLTNCCCEHHVQRSPVQKFSGSRA